MYKRQVITVDKLNQLDYKAICVFAAIGFFLEKDTYWKNKIVLPPASSNSIDKNQTLISSTPYFKWHYTPRDISFDAALEEFSNLFETIIEEQTKGKQIILPLSGGLDSRTQAVALQERNNDVYSYSYQYPNGFPETKIAKQIAEVCGFKFQAFKIPKGYLWSELDTLAKINKCYSDFTSP